jgi:hypothetical protein
MEGGGWSDDSNAFLYGGSLQIAFRGAVQERVMHLRLDWD